MIRGSDTLRRVCGPITRLEIYCRRIRDTRKPRDPQEHELIKKVGFTFLPSRTFSLKPVTLDSPTSSSHALMEKMALPGLCVEKLESNHLQTIGDDLKKRL